VGNRYWTNSITNFSSVQATNLNMAGGTFNAGGGQITNGAVYAKTVLQVDGASLSAAGTALLTGGELRIQGNLNPSAFASSRVLGSGSLPWYSITASNYFALGTITATNGFVDVPRSSAPTFAQIGSRTNTPVMWWSNSAPCVRYVTYYNASSNEVTTNLFSLP